MSSAIMCTSGLLHLVCPLLYRCVSLSLERLLDKDYTATLLTGEFFFLGGRWGGAREGGGGRLRTLVRKVVCVNI